MNIIDIVIVVFLLWGAIKGFIDGFVVQSLTLVALVLGIWAGVVFSDVLATFITQHFSIKGRLLPAFSFAIIFLFILIAMHFVSKLLTHFLGKVMLGTLNRIGGILFGIVKMAFIVSVMIVLLQKLDLMKLVFEPTQIEDSKLYKPVSKIAPAIFPHLHFEEIKNGILNGSSTK
jgi:membrane protein required for colicin V production